MTATVGSRGKRGPQTPQVPVKTTPVAAPPASAPAVVTSAEQSAALAHASKGAEALGVLVQYLVFRVRT